MNDDVLQFPDFPGRETLVARIDAAVAPGDPEQVVAALRRTLTELIDDPQVRLPDCVRRPCAERYARRELYRSPEHGYSVVAMSWAPGQGTPLHDHSGLWCVDGVWQGRLQVTQYALLERSGDRARFRPASTVAAARGSAGSLIPPHEYHILHNASDDALAVSVHVYQAAMERCAIFLPERDDWYRCQERQLQTEADC